MRAAILGLSLCAAIAAQEPTHRQINQSALIEKKNDSTYQVTYKLQNNTIVFEGKVRGNQIELQSCHRVYKIGKASMKFTTTVPPINHTIPDTFKVEGYHVSTLDERTENPVDSSYHYNANITEGLQLRGRTEDLGRFSHKFEGYLISEKDSVPFNWQLRTKIGFRCHKP